MKKSEAVDLILKEFNIPHDMTTPDFPRLLATCILQSLENAGMRPTRERELPQHSPCSGAVHDVYMYEEIVTLWDKE